MSCDDIDGFVRQLGQTLRISTDVNLVRTDYYDQESFWDKLSNNPMIRWDSNRQKPTGFDPQTWPATVCSTSTTKREANRIYFLQQADAFLDKSRAGDVRYISVFACIFFFVFQFFLFFSLSTEDLRETEWNAETVYLEPWWQLKIEAEFERRGEETWLVSERSNVWSERESKQRITDYK